jgi:hypothetical protein
MLLLTGDAQCAVKSAEVTPVAQGQNIDLLTVQALYVGLPFQLIIRKEAALEHHHNLQDSVVADLLAEQSSSKQ